MGNNNGHIESMSEVQLSRLPSGTSWSFQKCVLNAAKSDEISSANSKHKRNNDSKENVENYSSKKKKSDGSNSVGHETTLSEFASLEISENSKEFRKAINLLNHVGGQGLAVNKVTAVYNPTLVESFTSRLAILKARFSENANIFNKQDWKKNDPNKEREAVIEFYEKYVHTFAWNKGLLVPVIACVSVGTETEIESICKFGFSTNSPQATFGKLGQGIYVSNSPGATKESEEKKFLLISYVIAGNVYPLIEGDLKKEKPIAGNPVKNGYNSHIALVDPDNRENIVSDLEKSYVAEFVIEQRSQVIPAFIFHLK